jgi:peptidoglycan/LPS O-acetylase OafA/YrhL
MAERWPALDALRGLSVVLVVLDHAAVPWIPSGGRFGVTTFFVLSGFLITDILLKGPRLRDFYVRRTARLLPALVLVVAFLVAIGQAGWHNTFPVLAYAGNWWRIAGHSIGVLGQTWSLAVEEQFYLLWPFLLPLFASRPRRFALAIGAVLVYRLAWWPMQTEVVTMGTVANSVGLLIGAAIARYNATGPTGLFWFGSIGLVGLSTIPMALDDVVLFGMPMSAGLASLVLLGRRAGSSPTPLRWLGHASYAWYLWHFPLLRLWGGSVEINLYLCCIALLVATASTLLVEHPISKAANHLLRHGWREFLRGQPQADTGPQARPQS